MLKKTLFRSAALAASAALVAGAGVISLAPAAQALPISGYATFNPQNGNIDTIMSINSSGACVAPATKVRAIATGFGFPAAGQIIYSPQVNGFSTTGPMSLPVSNTFRIYAQNNASTPLVGAYDVRIQCVNNLGTTVYDEFQTTMNWTTPGNSYANIDNATFTSTGAPAVATSTVLTTDLASPQQAGTAIALTATVDAGATDPNAGTVEFFNGATSLGTATVSNGVATKAVSNIAVGAGSLTAVFGGASGFNSSTSAAVPFTITPAPALPTTTTINVVGSGVALSPVTINATVVPNNAAGNVEFYDGVTLLGSQAAASGTAAYTVNSPAVGSHSYTAKFVPTNTGDFVTSTSAASVYDVAAFTGDSDTQNITASIPAGELTISVTDTTAVELPATLETDGSQFRATGAIGDVTVIDTRSGSFGWVASGQLADFNQGASSSIAAENVGWTPTTPTTSNPLQTVTAGGAVTSANAVAPSDASNVGLASARVLATSPVGSSVGTAHLGAGLSLKAPTTTATGLHTAVLTLTVL